MKFLATILLLTLTGNLFATTYYVSATGSDSNPGTQAQPWQTIAKVNSATYLANDSVLFNRGDIFFGSVIAKRNNMTFGAYGTGSAPVITGFVTLSSWVEESSGFYKTSLTAKGNLRVVAMNGIPQEMGRTPNSGLGRNSWLYYEACTGSTVIKDYQLTNTPSRLGRTIIVRHSGWATGQFRVTNHTDSSLTITPNRHQRNANAISVNSLTKDHGYFFENDKSDCDLPGEWANDTANGYLYMNFGGLNPLTNPVKYAAVDTLFNCGAFTNITISNITFDGGGLFGVYSRNGSYISVTNCTFTNIGVTGFHSRTTSNVTVADCSFDYCLSTAIQVIGANSTTGLITRNTIGQVAPFEGMYQNFDASDGVAIANDISNCEASNNTIASSAYHGLAFNGNNAFVYRNKVQSFSKWLTDDGGIYSFSSNTTTPTTYTNRVVKENLILNGIGNTNGMPVNALPSTKGIYADDWTMNVTYEGNVIDSCSVGISCNSNENLTFRNNFFRSWYGLRVTRKLYNDAENIFIRNNINIVTDPKGDLIEFNDWDLNLPTPHTIASTLAAVQSDSNYHYGADFYVQYKNVRQFASTYSLPAWQALTGVSANDVIIPWDMSKAQLVYNWTASPVTVTSAGINSTLNGTFTNAYSLPAYSFVFFVRSEDTTGLPKDMIYLPLKFE